MTRSVVFSYHNYDDGNNGIFFDSEDPDDIDYDSDCCRNIFLDIANGYFD